MEVTIAKADADGGHTGGTGGDVGVAIGDAVVARQGTDEGDSAVEGEGVLQLSIVGGGHGGIAVEDATETHEVGAGGAVVKDRRAAAQVAVGKLNLLAKLAHSVFVGADLAVGE